jgi:hypothetical protein
MIPLGKLCNADARCSPMACFLAVAFGGETLTELRQALAAAENRGLGRALSPRVCADGQKSEKMGSLLGRAGLALPVADRLMKTVTYPHLFALMQDLRDMGGDKRAGATLSGRRCRALSFCKQQENYREKFAAPDDSNRIRATFELVFLSAWAQHASQPKPLKPGSATTALSDALGVTAFDEATPSVLDPNDE